ncbi:uncharacterized protein AMSG_07280 [Thecamonas trahens ATCC 50062]|uniref:Uncharacterized protein n=1 Tax=Thecamonas trahens ATCC 50062 TaxID=461836 RepID=A0A0L0DGM7_THETB|nr:hypothetical protein AMSG_07280 [Thecamonas trahens ATCC 50062]KNC51276.1 hypothetical protein AMSG_07280 [Thecamonas trahens ATCC 50062]|eukprot:XP_013756203.1 hypothetical protein AMSG_07280 [Thecamonas trahens ATCC 50062]
MGMSALLVVGGLVAKCWNSMEEEQLKEEMAQREALAKRERELRMQEFETMRASQRETIYKLIAMQEAEVAVGDADDALDGEDLTVDAIRHSANVSKRKRRAIERHGLPPARMTTPAFVVEAEAAAASAVRALADADGELVAARLAFKKARQLEAAAKSKDDDIRSAKARVAHSARSLDNALDVSAMLKEELALRKKLAAKLNAKAEPAAGRSPATPMSGSTGASDVLRAIELRSPPSPYAQRGGSGAPPPDTAAATPGPASSADASASDADSELNAAQLALGGDASTPHRSRSTQKRRTEGLGRRRRAQSAQGMNASRSKPGRRKRRGSQSGGLLVYSDGQRELVEARKSETRALLEIEAVARDTVRMNDLLVREQRLTAKAKAKVEKTKATLVAMQAKADAMDKEEADMQRKIVLLNRELKSLATRLEAKTRVALAELEKKLSFEQDQAVNQAARAGAEQAELLRTSPEALGALRSKAHDAVELLVTLKATRSQLKEEIRECRVQRRELDV